MPNTSPLPQTEADARRAAWWRRRPNRRIPTWRPRPRVVGVQS